MPPATPHDETVHGQKRKLQAVLPVQGAQGYPTPGWMRPIRPHIQRSPCAQPTHASGSGGERLTLRAQAEQLDYMVRDAVAGRLFKTGNNPLETTVVEALNNAALRTHQMVAMPAPQTVPVTIVQTVDALEHAEIAEEPDGAKDTGNTRRLVVFDQPLLDFLNTECTGQ